MYPNGTSGKLIPLFYHSVTEGLRSGCKIRATLYQFHLMFPDCGVKAFAENSLGTNWTQAVNYVSVISLHAFRPSLPITARRPLACDLLSSMWRVIIIFEHRGQNCTHCSKPGQANALNRGMKMSAFRHDSSSSTLKRSPLLSSHPQHTGRLTYNPT